PATRNSVAPHPRAVASLSDETSTAMTVPASANRAPCSAESPTPPRPITTTDSSGRTRAALVTAPTPVSTAQPSRAAGSSGTSSPIGITAGAGTTVSVAKAPVPRPGNSSAPSYVAWATAAAASEFWHSHGSPLVQNQQARHGGAQFRTTRAPGATWVTSEP